ncbi:hypothetical protein BGZ67_002257 [Mortierella alpina]|nr:hypothetical protein BGZ67_002257 [Mortierella alpina]
MNKTSAPSRKNSFEQDYESQHRRGHDSNNDGSNQNSIRSHNDGYAYESQSNMKTHSSEQGFEPWRNSGAGQNNRERSGGFNDNFSGNYNRGVNTNGSKSNPAGSEQRATGQSRSNNNRRSRSRSSSRSDHTRAASYRRDNLSPRLRRTDSSHSPTPDRRSPREDFRARHHSLDRGRHGQHQGYDRGQSHEPHYGERRRKISSPTPADTRHTPQWTPHVPSVAPAVEQALQVYGIDETYLQQSPYHPAAAPIPYAALLANSPAFVQGLAQLTALLTPQQTPPIESLYTIASALVSEAVQTTTATVLGPALVSMETGGLSAAGPSILGALEGSLYAKSSPAEQASLPNDYSNAATSIPTSQVTSTPLQVGGGASDALLARLSDPVTARLLQSISPFLSQIPSTTVASSQPTESIASAPPVPPQPVLSYPEPQRLDTQSGATDKDAAMSSSQTTQVTSVSALSFEISENGAHPSKEATKIKELFDSKPSSDNYRVQLDMKTENDMSVEVVSSTLDVKDDNVEESAIVTTSGSHEGILADNELQLGTDFVAIKAEKDSEPRIASARDVDASMHVTQGNERSEMDVERALMKREPSTEPYSVSLANSGSNSDETRLPRPPTVEEPKDSNTSTEAKAETMERATSLLDEPGRMMIPATESKEAVAIESGLPSAEPKSTSNLTVEGALEQNNVPQELDHPQEPTSARSAHEGTAMLDSGMELDHASDDMAKEASAEKPKAKGTSDSESGYALVSTDMDLEECPTVPDVENSSPGHTSPSLTDGPPANDNDNDNDNSNSHLENQPQLSSSPSRTVVSSHTVARNGVRVYPSWHHVPGADMALLSEMRASTADLGRFRRETRWLEERVSRPRRDAVSEDVFDKALGLTRTIPLLRQRRDHHHESQHPTKQQDRDQDHNQNQDRPYPRSHEHAERERPPRTRSSFVGAAVRVSTDSRLAYSTFMAQLMEEMEEQLRLESEQTALQRAVERTETKIKLKQRLGEQAEQKMREVLEKQAELDMELERVRKMEQEYLERREQQRRRAEDEIRQLEETLRTLQGHPPSLHL